MLKKTKPFVGNPAPFVMELPPYRVPTLNATLRHMWERSEQYLRKIGGLILVAAVVIWFLSYYPHVEPSAYATDVVEQVAAGASVQDVESTHISQAENSYLVATPSCDARVTMLLISSDAPPIAK